MRGIIVFAFAGVLSFGNNANAADTSKFDLVCTGSADDQVGGTHTPISFNQTLHIDLDRQQYCADTCSGILDVAHADPLLITLVDIPRHGGITDMRMEKRVIDRRTGEYSVFDFDAARTHSLSVKAVCSPKPFTPFRATKF